MENRRDSVHRTIRRNGRVRISIIVPIALIIMIAIASGASAEFKNYSIYLYAQNQLNYPGESPQVTINASFMSTEKQDITRKAVVKIYRLPEGQNTGDFAGYVKQASPSLTFTEKLLFKYNRNEWFNSSITVKVPPLSAGNYLFMLESEGKQYFSPCTVSALGLIAKLSDSELLVFAQDIKSSEPMAGTSLVIESQGTEVARGTTDAKGLFRLSLGQLNRGNAGYLSVKGSRGASRAVVSVNAGAGVEMLKGYIYTDRPIYRPSQKVFFKGILRTEKSDGALVNLSQKAIEVVIRDPKGQDIFKEKLKTDRFGCFNGVITLAGEPPLGQYFVNALYNNQAANGVFTVEEYRKPEFEITVTPKVKRIIQGEKGTFDIEARYYFGGPVTGAEFQYQIQRMYSYHYYYGQDYWWVDEPPGYSYGGDVIQNSSGKTDAQGRAVISFDAPRVDQDASYTVTVKMVDKSRREVSGSGSLMATKGNFYITMECDKYVYNVGDTANIKIKTQDYDDRPVSKDLKISVKAESASGKNMPGMSPPATVKTDSRGIAYYRYKVKAAGYYTIEAEATGQGQLLKMALGVYASAEGGYSWYHRGTAEIVLDKAFYDVGNKATVLIMLPHDNGHALVTLEGDSIYSYRVQKGSGSFTIPVAMKFSPAAYVTVTYFHDKNLVFTTKKLVVPRKDRFITLRLKSQAEKYEPRQTATYEVETTDSRNRPVSAQVTMGMADESVYAVLAESTPNIQKFFWGGGDDLTVTASSQGHSYGGRRYSPYHGIRGGEMNYLYDGLKGNVAKPAMQEATSLSSGAEKKADSRGSGGAAPAQPKFVRSYFPDTAYFNADLITDDKGRALVHIPLPDSLTTWRTTARAVTEDTSVGEERHKITVTKDLLARLIAPRFLTERDELVITGIIHNYLKHREKVLSEFSAEGVQLKSGAKKELTIPSDGSDRVDYRIVAQNNQKATFTLKAMGRTTADALTISIPILPHGTEKFQAASGDTTGKAEETLELPQESLKDTASLRVSLSPSLASSMFPALKYLIGYPYGCVEQTMSRFLPNVIVAQTLKDLMLFEPSMKQELPDMVKKGLDRLYNFNHPDGGWGWWESDQSHPFMTAYVVYGLSRARQAGYQIDPEKIKRGIGWLQGAYGTQKDPNTCAYMLFAMSEAGAMDKGKAQALYRSQKELNSYAKAVLAMTLYRAHLGKEALDLVDQLERSARSTGTSCCWSGMTGSHGWTDNETETTAYVLQALMLVKPQSSFVGKAVRFLCLSRKGDSWYSTKDTAAAVLALTEYLKTSKELEPDFTATMLVNDTPCGDFAFTMKDIGKKAIEAPIPAGLLKNGKNRIAFEMKGTGRLYYTAYLKYYSREEHLKSLASGFSVNRSYTLITMDGEKKKEVRTPLDRRSSDQIKVKSGDIIEVALDVTGDSNYEYVVIEDPKPAGCEVEDSIQGRYGSWSYWFSQREVRDEKVAFFVTYFNRGGHKVTYRLRAETPGTFHVMPTRVSLMYTPEIGGISNEAIMKIEEKGPVPGQTPEQQGKEEKRTGFWDSLEELLR
jgi:alpha-2-macroglobulin